MSPDIELDRNDLIGLAKFILIELDTINKIYNNMLETLPADMRIGSEDYLDYLD